MHQKNKVLFIAHDARRTGAINVLKHHLDYFKRNLTFEFDIALLADGPLRDEFAKIARVYNPWEGYQPANKSLKRQIWEKGLNKLIRNKQNGEDQYYSMIPFKEYNVVYGNTIITSGLLRYAKATFNSFTICHVHEMDYSIKLYVGKEEFLAAVPFVDLFLAASQAVKNNLVHNYGIAPGKIKVHYEHIPLAHTGSMEETLGDKENDGLKICGCGTSDWQKGMDVFIRAAYQLKKAYNGSKKFRFIWIGARPASMDYAQAMFDIQKMALEDCITIYESQPDPLRIVKQCDVFFLSSREDSFPLVCLEAASLKLPIICFKGGGGMVEFVNSNNGWVIPYLDVDAFVSLAVHLLQSDKKEIRNKGLQASTDVKAYDIELGGKKLASILNSVFDLQQIRG
jgi:glycosyltransferase involved in cell wall biosynthesis